MCSWPALKQGKRDRPNHPKNSYRTISSITMIETFVLNEYYFYYQNPVTTGVMDQELFVLFCETRHVDCFVEELNERVRKIKPILGYNNDFFTIEIVGGHPEDRVLITILVHVILNHLSRVCVEVGIPEVRMPDIDHFLVKIPEDKNIFPLVVLPFSVFELHSSAECPEDFCLREC